MRSVVALTKLMFLSVGFMSDVLSTQSPVVEVVPTKVGVELSAVMKSDADVTV